MLVSKPFTIGNLLTCLSVMIQLNTAAQYWIQKGAAINGEANLDRSGWSVSINEHADVVAVGAYKNGIGGSNNGHIRVHEYSAGAWSHRRGRTLMVLKLVKNLDMWFELIMRGISLLAVPSCMAAKEDSFVCLSIKAEVGYNWET
ncbi:MAG: hypothetical protein R2813_09850 [Flavobacteriales bacterium]